MKENMKILVGLDGSEHSMWALVEAIKVAKHFQGSLKGIVVYRQGKEEDAMKIQSKAKQLAETEQVQCDFSTLLGSNPSRALVDAAKSESSDLIVVGSRGLSSAASFLVGSVSRGVVTNAPCDVLVVKK